MDQMDTCPHCGEIIVLGNLPAGTLIKSREDIFNALVDIPDYPITWMSVSVTVTSPETSLKLGGD